VNGRGKDHVSGIMYHVSSIKYEKEKGRGNLQIAGIGAMQKFQSEQRDSLYETELMIPGKLHQPFFNKSGKYPFHAYDAITDCV